MAGESGTILDGVRIIPENVESKLLQVHQDYIYAPLRSTLVHVAELLPVSVTPNSITYASVATVVPIMLLCFFECYGWAFLHVVVHDLLDRLDGAVAAVHTRKGIPHDGNWGAFLDAICDKVFGICLILFLIWNCKPFIAWKLVALVKLGLDLTLAVVRIQDFYIRGPGGKSAAIRARGEGKLATFCENMGNAVFCLGYTMSSLTFIIYLAISLLLFILSIDMAIHSLRFKLLARAASSNSTANTGRQDGKKAQ